LKNRHEGDAGWGHPAYKGRGVMASRCVMVAWGGEPEARRYTEMSKKGRIPLIPAIPGIR